MAYVTELHVDPSPIYTCQGQSQLLGSIPSSFTFFTWKLRSLICSISDILEKTFWKNIVERNKEQSTWGSGLQLWISLTQRFLVSAPSSSRGPNCNERKEQEKRFYAIWSMQPEYTSGYFLSLQCDCYPASFSFPLLLLLLRRGLPAHLYYFESDVYFTSDTFRIFYLCLDYCNFVKIFQVILFYFFDESYFEFTGPCDSVSEDLQLVLENSKVFSSEVLHKSHSHYLLLLGFQLNICQNSSLYLECLII